MVVVLPQVAPGNQTLLAVVFFLEGARITGAFATFVDFFLAIGFLLLVTREDVDVFFEVLLLLGFFFTRLTAFFLVFLRTVLRRIAGFFRVTAFLRRGLRTAFLAAVFLRRRGLAAAVPTFFFLRTVFLLRAGVAAVERFLRRFGAADFLFTGIKSSPLENLTFAGIGTHT